MSPVAQLTCQGLQLSFTDSYRYLGQDILVSPRLLTELALTQVTRFQRAALCLCHATT